MTEMRSVRRGLTLVELLVVIAIVAVVAGIVYTSTGPVRENARRAVCMSNLRQIGLAIKLYREDYASVEFGPWHLMGLPPDPDQLIPYLKDERVFKCPNARPWELGLKQLALSYTWHRLTGPLPPEAGVSRRLPTFEEVIRRRGSDYPIMGDFWHDRPGEFAGPRRMFVLVLRLDGRAEARYVKTADSWMW